MNRALLLILLLASTVARATGPNLPLEFEADRYAARNWSTAILVDLTQVESPGVTREILRAGERISGEQLRLKPAAPKGEGPQRLEISLRAVANNRLKPGAYAQRIVVASRWRNREGGGVLHIERWYYFEVRGKQIIRLSAEEYERATDAPREGAGESGVRNRFYGGGDRLDAVPLSRTERSQSIRADSAISVSQEHPDQTTSVQQRSAEPDRSETKEP